MKRAGASVHTVAATHRVLRSCLSAAVDSGRLAVNQAKKVKVEKPPEVEVVPLTVDDATASSGPSPTVATAPAGASPCPSGSGRAKRSG